METLRKPVDEITFSDLRVHFGTGRSILVSGSGRNKVYRYRHGVMTDLGDLEISEWTPLAEQLIERAGEEELFWLLLDWETQHNYSRQSMEELKHQALRLHIDRVFDQEEWFDFIPFNRQYRPEVLEKADLIWTECSGCGTRQQMTRAQYTHLHRCFDGIQYCPGCGTAAVMIATKTESEDIDNG